MVGARTSTYKKRKRAKLTSAIRPSTCRSEPNEPTFTLRARDRRAVGLVRRWAQFQPLTPAGNPKAKAKQAFKIADEMEAYQKEHGQKKSD
tara:strand:- start:149 stop:421 length:273 start_codon:yes stop_codon:yes gene_type:complete